MTAASIPVDLFNPGQVFACMGFLEAAEALVGDAEGAFDWNDEGDVRFRLRARGNGNAFGHVLGFLATAEIRRYAPPGYADPLPRGKKSAEDDESEGETLAGDVPSDEFPGRTVDTNALPIRLTGDGSGGRHIDVGHWTDTSSRNDFKLYSGNRSAAGIARAMLRGTRETLGLGALWTQDALKLEKDPFGIVTPMGGSFNFDPRGAWTGIDAGYSPNDHSPKHGLSASPVLEVLAAIGLEHARPDEYEPRHVRYAVWQVFLPPTLARPVLGGARLAIPQRHFAFELALSGKNKVVTFAQEEKLS